MPLILQKRESWDKLTWYSVQYMKRKKKSYITSYIVSILSEQGLLYKKGSMYWSEGNMEDQV